MKLKLVQVLFRHGERTPLKGEHTVLNIDPTIYQPYGLEQLTNRGKRQAYALGRMLRERYRDYLSERYVQDELYAYASDTDRTKATLQLVLAALYPPERESAWSTELKWQPVPFRCVPTELDLLLNGYRNPVYLAMRQQQYDSREFKQLMTDHADFITLVNENTGEGGKNVNGENYRKIYTLFNLLRIHERMNLPLPSWYTTETKDTLFAVFLKILEIKSLTPEMRKINSGPLLRKILNAVTSTDARQEARKLHLYSGHDLNIAGALRSLRVEGAKFSDFASALIFEKHVDSKTGETYVKLLYWQTVGEEMTTLRINGHDEFCHVDDFKRTIAEIIPTDDELEKWLNYMEPKRLKNLCMEYKC